MRKKEKGQIILVFALALPLLILFAAMAIDMGIIYSTKARLSNAVDAAVLTGVKNYSQGTATAQALATDIFNANFGANPPTPTFTWCPSPDCPFTAVSLTATATTTVNTLFMGYLPGFAQWQVSDTGTATRSNLVMSIILDRSGSMSTDGGGSALQTAVPIFINNFAQGSDYVAMISFASNATLDVPETTQFVTPITNKVNTMSFIGGTFGTGAGTNTSTCSATSCPSTNAPPLSMADYQNNSITFPAGQPEVKVVVYFTDGLMNTIQDTFNCTNTPPGPITLNYGGYDLAYSSPAAFLPTDGTQLANIATNGPVYYDTSYDICQGVTTFPSQQYGQQAFTQAAVTAEAQYRGLVTANAMRSESPVPTYIYVIGLGTGVNTAFLQNLANDPDGTAYNPNLPTGLFLAVPNCPSVTCTTDLTTAFQTIAAKILLRLSQ